MLREKLDILCIQETRLSTFKDVAEVQKLWVKGKSFHSIGESKADGIGILFFSENITVIQLREIIPGRLMLVDVFLFGKKIRIINLYTAQDRARKIQLFNKIKTLLCVGFYVIVCGDFNTVTDERDRIAERSSKIGREGNVLKQIMNEYDMHDTFRMVYPDRIDFTRFDRTCKTRIDRIYVNKKFAVISYKTKMLIDSDHLTVIYTINFLNDQCVNYWKLNTKILKYPNILLELKDELTRIGSLSILTKDKYEVWEIVKTRVKNYFKYKSKLINQEKNERYNRIMEQYIILKLKPCITAVEENSLRELKDEIDVMNNEPLLKLQIKLGVHLDETLNPSQISYLFSKQKQRSCATSIRDKNGIIITESGKVRHTIKELCEEMYQEIEIDVNMLKSFLNFKYDYNYDHLGDEIKESDVVYWIRLYV